jgi:hypothetical protein
LDFAESGLRCDIVVPLDTEESSGSECLG